ncbi:MAG: relaxase/mobilization nuclease domain-containing protein [Cyanobacteria bacterium J06621_12]
MLIKFFARGAGGGRGPVEYITRLNDPSTGQLRSPAPQVLRGNPIITRRLIDSLEFKHKYRSGVLSFATEDAPTDKQIEAVIDSFENYAFAGLDKDAYNTLWVKHTHTGNNRVELHFVTPRVELYTGKSLNIAPPGWHGYFKPWQTSWNIKQDWARPDDPTRKRDYEPGFQALINAERKVKGLEPITDTKKLLTEYVLERVAAGLIGDRDGIIALFKDELGLEITRKGKDYITVLDSETTKRYRLKGKLYEREFRPQPEITAKVRSRTESSSGFDERELRAVTERIKSNYEYRYRYHQKRYGASKHGSDLGRRQILVDSSSSRIEPLSGYLRRQLGDNAILVESDSQETRNVGFSDSESRFPIPENVQAAEDSKIASRIYDGSNDYSNRQRNISDSADQLNPESWLAMPRKTLYEAGALKDTATHIGVEDERTRKQTNDRFRKASRAVQAGYDEFVPQVQFGYESARGAEQTATLSSDELERSSQQLERTNREVERLQQQNNLDIPRVRRALKRKRVKQLERFKTEINLVDYAISLGYKYSASESNPTSALLHSKEGDKIVVVTNTQGRSIYFSLGDDAKHGTIIDFVQHRRNFNLGEVRKELRPWLNRDLTSLRDNYSMVSSVSKPEPSNQNEIDKYLNQLKNLHQPSPRVFQRKQKKRGQLEL